MLEKNILYGTHNSGTSSKLVCWQRLFGFLLHLTSRCQNRSISEQIHDGVVLYNFQVCYYRNNWHFSHGLCIYTDLLIDSLNMLRAELLLHPSKVIYYQLVLDKNFLVGQDVIRFKELLSYLLEHYNDDRLVLQWCNIEGDGMIYINPTVDLSYEEHYWTSSWCKINGTKLLDRLPLPHYHSKKFNDKYRSECSSDVLMLDYYNE